jgi:hypothetical protein
MLLTDAVAVSAMFVPEGVPELTCSTVVNPAEPLMARVAVVAVQVMVPAFPIPGVTQFQPEAGGVIDWKLVLGGVTSVKVVPAAVTAGPRLVMLCV